jgi:hypothetical protein
MQTLVFAIYCSALLTAIGSSFIILFSAYTVCKRSALDFARKVETVNDDFDKILAEATLRKSVLMERIEELDLRVEVELDAIRTLIRGKKLTVLQQLERVQKPLDEACANKLETRECISSRPRTPCTTNICHSRRWMSY